MRITNDYVAEPVEWIKGSDVKFGGWTEDQRDEFIQGKRSEEDLGQEENVHQKPMHMK